MSSIISEVNLECGIKKSYSFGKNILLWLSVENLAYKLTRTEETLGSLLEVKEQGALGGKFQHLCQTEGLGSNIDILLPGSLYLLNQSVGPIVVSSVWVLGGYLFNFYVVTPFWESIDVQ